MTPARTLSSAPSLSCAPLVPRPRGRWTTCASRTYFGRDVRDFGRTRRSSPFLRPASYLLPSLPLLPSSSLRSRSLRASRTTSRSVIQPHILSLPAMSSTPSRKRSSPVHVLPSLLLASSLFLPSVVHAQGTACGSGLASCPATAPCCSGKSGSLRLNRCTYLRPDLSPSLCRVRLLRDVQPLLLARMQP